MQDQLYLPHVHRRQDVVWNHESEDTTRLQQVVCHLSLSAHQNRRFRYSFLVLVSVRLSVGERGITYSQLIPFISCFSFSQQPCDVRVSLVLQGCKKRQDSVGQEACFRCGHLDVLRCWSVLQGMTHQTWNQNPRGHMFAASRFASSGLSHS